MKKHVNIAIFIPHLGCPFSCIYCNQKTIAAQEHVPDADEVQAIIEQCLPTIPAGVVPELAFFGGNFTTIDFSRQKAYLEAVRPYLDRGLVQGIRISTRPDGISAAILTYLQDYGVETIELGVQSLNDEVLRASARGYSAADVFKSARLIQDYGFQLGLQFMVGLPGDDREKDLFTTAEAIRLQPQMVRIYPTLVLRDTVLEQMWRQGRYTALTLEEALEICTEMVLAFEAHGIPVIRLGLHPGEELRQEGAILAGPFHPAFGERVEQRIFLEQASMAIKQVLSGHPHVRVLDLYAEERDLSKLIGYKRQNLLQLQQDFALSQLNVKTIIDQQKNWVAAAPAGVMPERRLEREIFYKLRKVL